MNIQEIKARLTAKNAQYVAACERVKEDREAVGRTWKTSLIIA